VSIVSRLSTDSENNEQYVSARTDADLLAFVSRQISATMKGAACTHGGGASLVRCNYTCNVDSRTHFSASAAIAAYNVADDWRGSSAFARGFGKSIWPPC
jgi:hypothetical protein